MSDQIIARRIAAIGEDREHGSTLLTLKAVRVLGEAAEGALSDARWAWDLARTARQLADAKPAMAGVRNASAQLLGRLLALGPVEGRRQATTLAEGLVTALREASASAAARAASLLPQDAAVATCSFSSAVLETLRAATGAGEGRARAGPGVGPRPRCPRAATGRRTPGGRRRCGGRAWQRRHRRGAPGNAGPGWSRRRCPRLHRERYTDPGLGPGVEGPHPLLRRVRNGEDGRTSRRGPGHDAVPIELVTAVVTEDGAHSPEEIGRRLSAPKDA